MQTDLIDWRNDGNQVDVYDLGQKDEMGQYPSRVGLKQFVDRAVGTDFQRQQLSTKDWFYSEFNRRLTREFFEKNNLEFSYKKGVGAKFAEFDS